MAHDYSFHQKLGNMKDTLLQYLSNTKGFPSPIQGEEREHFNKTVLSAILPNGYRVGKGVIIDADNRKTGQVDGVIEMPFSISFPISAGENRLYLADGVGIAIEIKSELTFAKPTTDNPRPKGKWYDIVLKAHEIQDLVRQPFPERTDTIVDYRYHHIPTFGVAYTGCKKIETLQKWVQYFSKGGAYPLGLPHSIYIIESGLYFRCDGKLTAKGQEMALFAFISDVLQTLHFYERQNFNFSRYISLLKAKK